MLSGEGMLRRKTVKNNNTSNQQKQLCACSTHFCTFLCRFFFLHNYNVKLLSYTFYGWNVVSVPVHFFSLPHIFTLLWWPLQNFHVVLLCFFFISWSKKQFPLSVFVFIDCFVISALQDAGGYSISSQNILELHLGCHTLLIELLYLAMPVVRTGLSLLKYNRTPVSIQDKFSFCHRGPTGIENGK